MEEKLSLPNVIVDAGVDWLTLTAEAGSQDALDLEELGYDEVCEERALGEKVKRRAVLDYDATICGGISIGTRKQGVMLRGSGESAKRLAGRCVRDRIRAKCTRIDLQTTVRHPEGNRGRPARLLSALRKWEAENPSETPRNSGVIENSSRRGTFHAGSRCTSQYLRCYDKSLEVGAGGMKNLFRYELELKRGRARQVWAMCQSAASQFYLSCSLVMGYLQACGLEADWMQNHEVCPVPPDSKKTSDESTLWWLETQVVPAVARLVSHGHGESVESLLSSAVAGKRPTAMYALGIAGQNWEPEPAPEPVPLQGSSMWRKLRALRNDGKML